jgi:hypothetical protein
MEDVLFVAGLVAFFALCIAYIRFCDGIIGPDPLETAAGTSPDRERVDAGAR